MRILRNRKLWETIYFQSNCLLNVYSLSHGNDLNSEQKDILLGKLSAWYDIEMNNVISFWNK